jgi:alpha-glucuronidase
MSVIERTPEACKARSVVRGRFQPGETPQERETAALKAWRTAAGRFVVFVLVSILLCLSALDLKAEDGYRLWLRYEKIDGPELLDEYARHATEIVVPSDSATGRIIKDELRLGLSGLLGKELPITDRISRNGAIVVATPAGSLSVASLGLDPEIQAQGDDGYILRSMTNGQRAITVIASQTERGALYGTFHFLRLLETRQDIAHLNILEKPMLERRLLDHWDNLDGSVERGYAGKSLWNWKTLPDTGDPRYRDYAKANGSVGINGVVLNNVNARPEQLSAENLKKAAALAGVFRPYGIRVYLTANFASPKRLGGASDSNPNNPEVQSWWKRKADEIYSLIPDFGGLLVKANSEGQPGPQDYGLTHADGANLLADALRPHGGIVMWRAFVYNSPNIDHDRAKRAYTEFKPLDGQFRDNVFIQVKNGPIDFQPREPFHPLFGAMRRTPLMPELEITQENLGHSTDLVYLDSMWKDFLDSDTFADGPNSPVSKLLSRHSMTGIAGVANVGRNRNWCGHDFAQANWYAFGRLAWNSGLSAKQIAEEWTRMTWSNDPRVVSTIVQMMAGSWEACVNYEMPLGLHHIMEGNRHYDPRPELANKSAPDYSAVYYHRAARDGIGFDRTRTGSDAVSQYAAPVRDKFDQLETCPPELLLWFHHVGWDYRLRTGRDVWEELCFRYNDGVSSVKRMQTQWAGLLGEVDDARFNAVRQKLDLQLLHATKWRDTCLGYFQSVNQKPFPNGSRE